MSTREHWPWAWATSSTVVLLLGVWAGSSYRDDRSRADRYRAAPVCQGTPSPDCIHEARAVVVDTRTHNPRRGPKDRYVDFRMQEPTAARAEGVVEIEGPSPVYDALRPGTPIRLGVWGRVITRVSVDGVGTAETVDSPSVAAVRDVALAILGFMWGGPALWAAFVLRRRKGSWWGKAAFPQPKRATPKVIVAFAWFGFSFGIVLRGPDVGTLVAQGAFVGLLGGLIGAALYFWARRSGRAADSR